MASTISAFFSSLLPSYNGRQATPGEFGTESGTTGSASPPPSMPMRNSEHTAERREASRADSAAGEPDPDPISPQELRNLRAQFLDDKFGPQGKKKRAGRTFTSPKIEAQP